MPRPHRLDSARLKKARLSPLQTAGCEKAFVTVPLEAFSEHVAQPGALAAACPSISRRQLLHQSVVAAYVLRACGVERGDRLILLMPHCIEQMVWMLAAKRIGALYVSMSVNISLKARRTRSLLAPHLLLRTFLLPWPCASYLNPIPDNLHLTMDFDPCLTLSSAPSSHPRPPSRALRHPCRQNL